MNQQINLERILKKYELKDWIPLYGVKSVDERVRLGIKVPEWYVALYTIYQVGIFAAAITAIINYFDKGFISK